MERPPLDKLIASALDLGTLSIRCRLADNQREVWWYVMLGGAYEGVGHSLDEACRETLKLMTEHAAKLDKATAP